MTADEPSKTTTTSQVEAHWVIPPLSLEEQLLEAQFVVKGTISLADADAGAANLSFEEILLGRSEAEPRSPVSVVLGPETVEGRSGIWLIGEGDPHEVLLGPSHAKEPEVRRILAGRPRLADPPTVAEIVALAARSDRVVFVRLEGSGPEAAEATVEEGLRGDGPPSFAVVKDPEGGAWVFPTEAPSYGVLFLRSEGERWVALNDQEPARYGFTQVKEALR